MIFFWRKIVRKDNWINSVFGNGKLKKSLCMVLVAGMMLSQVESPALAQGLAQTGTEAALDHAITVENKSMETVSQFKERKREPLMGGYFRTWYDKHSTGEDGQSHNGVNSIGEIPKEVDFLMIFHDWTAANSNFWRVLKEEYVPKLHKQDTKLIRTIGAGFLTGEVGISKEHPDKDTRYTNDEAGYKNLAKDIVDTYVYQHNLDGLDIDIEIHNEPGHGKQGEEKEAEIKKAVGVIREIANLIGERGKDKTKFFIMDTTLHAGRRIQGGQDVGPNNRVFLETYQYFDYFFVQVYGPKGENGLDNGMYGKDHIWETFRDYIPADKFFIGFTFYEDGGNQHGNMWGDTLGTPEDSRAQRYAEWQPDGGLKGGIFSYAIERDGVEEGNNNKFIHTTYEWTKSLKNRMLQGKDSYVEITAEDFPDAALRAEVIKQIGNHKGNIKRYNRELVLTDPAIVDLSGLEKIEKLKKLTLSGLSNLEKLSSANLPASLKVTGAPKEEAEATLVLSGLTNLKEVDLSGLALERLPQAAAEWKKLEAINLSDNCLDLSENTADRKILEEMIASIQKNSGSINGANVKIGSQRPKGYYPRPYEYKDRVIPLDKDVNSNEKYDLSGYRRLYGQRTLAGSYIWDEGEFNQFKEKEAYGQKLIADDWSYADFQCGYIYSDNLDSTDYIVEITDHENKKIEAPYEVSKKEDGSYLIEFFLKQKVVTGNLVEYKKGEKIHETLVIVGNAPKELIRLTTNAKALGHSFGWGTNEAWLPLIFDGQVENPTRFRAMGKTGWVAFDLGEVAAKATHWTVYNDTIIKTYPQGDKDNNTKKAEIQYLNKAATVTAAELADNAFLGDDSNWTTVGGFDDLVDHDFYNGELYHPVNARYWRYHILEGNPNGGNYVRLSIPELIIFGSDSDLSANTTSQEIVGKVGERLKEVQFDIELKGGEFVDITPDMKLDLAKWATPSAVNLQYTARPIGSRNQKIRITVSGVPEEETEEAVQMRIPKEHIKDGQADLLITKNPNLKIRIEAADPVVWAAAQNETIAGRVGEALTAEFVITLAGSEFDHILADMDITDWIAPKLDDVKYTANIVSGTKYKKLKVSVSGTPKAAQAEKALRIVIPQENIRKGKAALTVTDNSHLTLVVKEQPKPVKALIAGKTIAGKVGEALRGTFEIVLLDGEFAQITPDMDITDWITPELAEVKYTANIAENSGNQKMSVSVSGTPKAEQSETMLRLDIPKENIKDGQASLTAVADPELKIRIAAADLPQTPLAPHIPAAPNSEGATEKVASEEKKPDTKTEEKQDGAPTSETQKFEDVKENAWYATSVKFVQEKGLMMGTGENSFNPEQKTTRAMLTTLLYRLEGKPAVTGESKFTDVKSGDYFFAPTVWAKENKIVAGFEDQSFRPDSPITREQIAVILANYARLKGFYQAEKANLTRFADGGAVSKYAAEAMQWANAVGLIQGNDENKLLPQGEASRAEIAAIIERFYKKFMQNK